MTGLKTYCVRFLLMKIHKPVIILPKQMKKGQLLEHKIIIIFIFGLAYIIIHIFVPVAV